MAAAQSAFALKMARQAIQCDNDGRYAEALEHYRESILALENVLANSDDSWQDALDGNPDFAQPDNKISEKSRKQLIQLRTQYIERVDQLLASLPTTVSSLYNSKGFGVLVPPETLESMSLIPPDQLSSEPFLNYDAHFEVIARDDPTLLAHPEPCPSSNSQRPGPSPHKPYWRMRLLSQTMITGGMLTPRLHVPRNVWYQSGARFVAIESKFAACEELYVSLRAVQRGILGDSAPETQGFYVSDRRRRWDGDQVNAVLAQFEQVVFGVQAGLAKKLKYLESEGVKIGTLGRDSGSLGRGAASGMDASSSGNESRFSKWGSKLTRSLSTMGVKKTEKVADLSTYIQLLTRLFNLCQLLDDWLYIFDDNGFGGQNFDLLERLWRISDFFDSVVLVFVMKDFEILMDRYVKKMGQVLLLPN